MDESAIRGMLLGLAVGDAIGLPHEFKPRYELARRPVRGMESGGTWGQEAGIWSDDSSLSFCLAENLIAGYDLGDLARRFIRWKEEGYWTAAGTVLDIGRSTALAIDRLKGFVFDPREAGLRREQDNGNGSIMRILPILVHVEHMGAPERDEIVSDVSSLTHAHRRSVLACIILIEYALLIKKMGSAEEAFNALGGAINARCADESELERFRRILDGSLPRIDKADLGSSGYVVDTVEAAIYCILSTTSYENAVLAAVNLGSDTDTTGCVTGGLAGLLYGPDAIPRKWLEPLSRREDIEDLARRLASRYPG